MADVGDILNMSLDQIIESKQKKSSAGPRTDERRKKLGSGRRADRGDDRGGRSFEEGLRVTVRNSGTRKPRAVPGRVLEVPRQPDAPRNWDALDGSAAWEHDMFDEGPSVLARHHRPAMSGFKLLITNLDYKVSDEDIQELFENCGTVKKAGIVYDRSGRSEEAAEVIFERREDAIAAVKRYNNLQLDNKPMRIELIEAGGGVGGPGGARTLSSGIRIGGASRATAVASRPRALAERSTTRVRPASGSNIRRGSSGNGKARQARGRGAAISQDDLDKDLDSYMATD